MDNCIEEFRSFTQKIKHLKILHKAIESAFQKYQLGAFHVESIDQEKAFDMFLNIQEKFYKTKVSNRKISWVENQLKVFIWVLVCHIYLKNTQIEALSNEDWSFFQQIFPYKNVELYKYQCQLITMPRKPKVWSKDEEDLLHQIIKKQDGNLKWHQISKSLFQISRQTYFRSPKQCRERWNNYLNPHKSRGSWKAEQYLTVLQNVKKEGRKWARVSKLMNNSRDEHSIKNKFNSLIKKQKKLTPLAPDSDICDILIAKLKNIDSHPKDLDQFLFNASPLTHHNQQEPQKDKNYGEILRRKLMNFNIVNPEFHESQLKIINKQQQIPQLSLQSFDYNGQGSDEGIEEQLDQLFQQ